ncbi:energy transducer TonB, partial [Myxococcus sp. CA039A]|nr:energy transducer TonB [Myxococcus sp. CA039A]
MSTSVLESGVLPRRGGSGLFMGFVTGSFLLHGLGLVVLHTRPPERPAPQRPVELVMVEVTKPPPPPPPVVEEPKPE